MISYILSIFSYLFKKQETNLDENVDEEVFLAEEIFNQELLSNSPACDDSLNFDSGATSDINACFQRTGVITYKGENYVLIDGMLFFDTTNCPIKVDLNDKVCYLCTKQEDETLKVVRLLENLGLSWGEEEVVEESFKVIDHVIIGEVAERVGRLVILKGSDLNFSLDDIEANFVPIQGDWLELKCSVQWDDVKVTNISAKNVVKICSFKALRSKIKKATVNQWDGEEGICDNNIYFSRQTLQNGTDPQIGMQVLVEIIESNQGGCIWRAIRLIPDDTVTFVPKQKTVEVSEEEISFKIEHENQISMTHPIKFSSLNFNETESINLNITNESSRLQYINKWIIVGNRSDSQIIVKPFIKNSVRLNPRQTFTLTITCQPKFLGHSRELLVILFRGFQLKRYIDVEIVHSTVPEINMNGSNTKGRKSNSELVKEMWKIKNKSNNSFVPGVRPIRPANFVATRLGMFPIPDKVWTAVLGDADQMVMTNEFNKVINRIEDALPCLSSVLTIQNYTDKWHTLLYMEEIQQNLHMRTYDMPKAFLDRHQEFLGIEIKGLAERRPSLIVGDKVIAKDIWDANASEYEGFIHALRGNIVLIKFHPQFHEKYFGSDVSLEFHSGRTVYRRCHQAINLAISNLGPDLLFPSKISVRNLQLPPELVENITWFNRNLNLEQMAAVKSILVGECRPLPYCIYGPPGTGKTVTVIETILQILTFLPDSRILVATPSNSASNLITERLLEYRNVFSDSIIRLIANHLVESDNIPDIIKPFCATIDISSQNTSKPRFGLDKNKIQLQCQSSFIGRHRVTIGTCICLGNLAQIDLPRGHFTHVIVDEAGQATEPEIMIPMTFTDKENGQIILAGDPMQLGPVVISKYCVEFGMSESYLSRILERFPYQKDYVAYKHGFDQRLVTKLNDNYRSVEPVLTLPSQMFYDGSLVPKINTNEDWIVKILNAVSNIFPCENNNGGIFVQGIRGFNSRAEDSPSWFNPQEASMVALTTCKLYKNGVTPEDVGVITPYIAQIKHLRLIFDAMGLPQPKIGTVEEFQGQERPIILISTVRSTESYLPEDQKHSLGFVQSPKRLNVALTRAQVAAILFCNPHLLCCDQLWGQVVKAAVAEKKYFGCDLPPELRCDTEI